MNRRGGTICRELAGEALIYSCVRVCVSRRHDFGERERERECRASLILSLRVHALPCCRVEITMCFCPRRGAWDLRFFFLSFFFSFIQRGWVVSHRQIVGRTGGNAFSGARRRVLLIVRRIKHGENDENAHGISNAAREIVYIHAFEKFAGGKFCYVHVPGQHVVARMPRVLKRTRAMLLICMMVYTWVKRLRGCTVGKL